MESGTTSKASPHPVKGILKREHTVAEYGQQSDSTTAKIRWDEDNLMITEAQKNSTMKITEPKTPFIHYNMNTDEITGHSGEVPPMELTSALETALSERMQSSSSSMSSFMLTSDTESVKSGHGSEHHATLVLEGNGHKEWDDDDVEGLHDGMTPEEREKHIKFEKLRAQHYNMKMALAEARRKMEEEDEAEEEVENGNGEYKVEDYDEDEEGDDDSDFE